ncbi:hypothetical protein C5F44_13330 [Fuscovulum blasticum DSM 2131]|uniref:EF-hand domain-containing protein n=2 Tax=Fuscovulum blasticum TaxID=1075 RepID=A0A2T4J6K6_FUSBL|nr:hypothetical protein C5F44_13330 [Fuscovulum blasticum DSM 2131]
MQNRYGANARTGRVVTLWRHDAGFCDGIRFGKRLLVMKGRSRLLCLPMKRRMTTMITRTLTLALATTALLAMTAAAQETPAPDAKPAAAPDAKAPVMFENFDAMDTDKDGKVTQAEIDAWRAARFAEADADKDGFLSKEELVAMRLKEIEARMMKGAERMVGKLDADKDGKLSPAELPASRMDGRVFDLADADNDGSVTKEELADAMKWLDDKKGHKGKKGGKGHGGHGEDVWGWGWN